MYGLAQIYTGCKCRETWQVAIGQTEDVENDEVYTFLYCTVCGGDGLTEKRDADGTPHYHEVTEEEHRVLSGCYSDESFDDDE